MAIYSILIHPDPRLRLPAQPVTHFDDALAEIVQNMYETMYHFHGIGLAAPQVNIRQRLIVMDVPQRSAEEGEKAEQIPSDKLVLVNPEIVQRSEECQDYEEGCLSLPNQYALVTRPANITVRYQDITGATQERAAQGLLSVCIQHEIDHLNGGLFIDHLSRLKRERLEKKLAKSLKNTKKS